MADNAPLDLTVIHGQIADLSTHLVLMVHWRIGNLDDVAHIRDLDSRFFWTRPCAADAEDPTTSQSQGLGHRPLGTELQRVLECLRGLHLDALAAESEYQRLVTWHNRLVASEGLVSSQSELRRLHIDIQALVCRIVGCLERAAWEIAAWCMQSAGSSAAPDEVASPWLDWIGRLRSSPPSDRKRTLAQLYRLDPPVVALYTQSLRSSQWQVRVEAALGLERLATRARSSAPDLVRALGDEAEAVRASAAGALVRISAGLKWALPALVRHLDDESVASPLAALLIGRMGKGGRAAVPRLTELLHRDTECCSRETMVTSLAAAQSLWQIEGPNGDSLRTLVCLLHNPRDEIAAEAARILGRLRPRATEVVDTLQGLLASKSAYVRHEAQVALRRINGRRR